MTGGCPYAAVRGYGQLPLARGTTGQPHSRPLIDFVLTRINLDELLSAKPALQLVNSFL